MKKQIVVLAMLITVSVNAQWVQISNGMYPGYGRIVKCLAVSGTNLFAGNISGLYLSTNYGINWTPKNSGITNSSSITAFAVSGTNLFAGTEIAGVYRSTNNGTNWVEVNSGLSIQRITALAVSGNNIYAGTWDNPNGGVFLSTNNGNSWTAINNGLTELAVGSIAVSGTSIFAGTYGGGIFLSTNNGTNWSEVNNGLTDHSVLTLLVSGTNIIAGTYGIGGVYLSTNNGTSWNAIGLSGEHVYSLAVSGTTLIAGTILNGIFSSTNNGINWFNKNQGFNFAPSVYALAIINNYIFAGTDSSAWRRPLTEIVGIQNSNIETPTKYSLSQNYPNPFNPTTKIKFAMPRSGVTKIVVYDVMGREVQTLVNERLQPGTYETSFDGSTLNSGVYFYKLTTDGFTETKKMLLLK